MPSFIQALGAAAKVFTCTALGSAENYFRLAGSGIFGRNNSPTAAFAGALRRQLCNQNPPPVPPAQIPSGQCVGTEYNIVVDYEQYSSLNKIWNSIHFEHSGCNFEVGGPIDGPRRYSDGSRTYTEWTYTKLGTGQRVTTSVNWSNNAKIRNFQYRYVRCDGNQSAACDTPTVPNDPGWNYSPNTKVTYDVGGNSYNVDVNFTFKGFEFDVNGNIVAVVNAAYVDADLNAPVNVDLNIPIDFGGINFDFGGNRPDQEPPGGDGCPPPKPPDAEPVVDPPPSEDPDQTDEDEPVDPSAQVIRGALVTVTSLDLNRQVGVIQQDDNPDILIPAAGYVSFKIAVGNTVGWTSDIPVKNIRNFIPCPWDRGAIEVTGTPRPGVVWTITPVLSKLDETV